MPHCFWIKFMKHSVFFVLLTLGGKNLNVINTAVCFTSLKKKTSFQPYLVIISKKTSIKALLRGVTQPSGNRTQSLVQHPQQMQKNCEPCMLTCCNFPSQVPLTYRDQSGAGTL